MDPNEHVSEQSRHAIETKAASPAEMADVFDEFMRAFEAFKDTNDARLAELEQRMASDVVTEEKLARINAALDEQKRFMDALALEHARPEIGARSLTSGPRSSALAREHKAAFDAYVRKGETGPILRLEEKALSAGSNPDGGYLVPDDTERTIMQAVKDISPIRQIAGNRQVSATIYKKPFSVSGPGTGWVGETDARPETTSPTLAELAFPTVELYAMPAATSTLLDDSAVDIDAWIAEEVAQAFAAQEGGAFVNGDGVNKPTGLLNYTKVDNASWSWGNIGYRATGTAGAFDAANPSDDLIDLVYTLKAGYRANAHWLMNRAVQAEIRKFKDSNGDYLWQPPASPGAPPSLMNFPIAESEDMPNIATDSYSIAFGDFRRGYLVVDRIGIRILRDPYSSKPYVLFYTTKRVGGGVQDFDAIKLLKFGVA